MKKPSGFPVRLAALLLSLMMRAAFPAFAEDEKGGDAFVFEDTVPQEYTNKRVSELPPSAGTFIRPDTPSAPLRCSAVPCRYLPA